MRIWSKRHITFHWYTSDVPAVGSQRHAVLSWNSPRHRVGRNRVDRIQRSGMRWTSYWLLKPWPGTTWLYHTTAAMTQTIIVEHTFYTHNFWFLDHFLFHQPSCLNDTMIVLYPGHVQYYNDACLLCVVRFATSFTCPYLRLPFLVIKWHRSNHL